MKIKSSLTATAVAFSLVFFFGPTTHAKEATSTEKEDSTPVKITIQVGDTLSSIADAHNTTYVRIFNANDFLVNPDIINAGDSVRIPTAEETLPDRYSERIVPQVAPTTASQSPTIAQTPSVSAAPIQPSSPTYASNAGNTYYRGYCTWYAKERRPDLPNMLGNGGQWVANAAARGYSTGSTPRPGAIAEMPGHVAVVESVNGDGTIVISEMNGPAGFGVVGTRTDAASKYRYIY